ncbi:MAG: response regulator [Acidimicrobiales bacterium]|nr:response regulator [Acidimicrobiales bacterium]RZV46943.1 MAG: response regulator [Acidimicrobiales bacterium]
MRNSTSRILLIEDNELDARQMLKDLGGSDDFAVDRTADLAAARHALKGAFYDCILLDLSLPDSQGLVGIDALIGVDPDTPIVVLTGLDDPKTAEEAVARGAQDYLVKGSSTADTISRAIRYAIARHRVDSELRTTTELLEVMNERERIARDLHDTVIQQLFATGMSLQATAGQTETPARQNILEAVDGVDAAIRQLRETIFRLHSPTAQLSLAESIDDVATEARESLGFAPAVRVGDIGQLPAEIQTTVTAVVREGLANIARHARATAAEVSVSIDDHLLVLMIDDNGVGVGPQPLAPRELTGHGVPNMFARAEELDGSFHIGPGPGGGTCIEWKIPIR